MKDLINQIIELVKSIADMIDASLLGPITEIGKTIGLLLVKIFELGVMIIKWVIAQV